MAITQAKILVNGAWETVPPGSHTHAISDVTGLQTALDAKANSSDVSSSLALKADESSVSTALAAKAPLASPTFTGTVAGITAAMVGLGNVNNTADSAKPVSTAQQTALDLKAPLASPTFTGTVSGVTAAMVGLGSVNNTADSAKPISTAQQTALDLKAPLASPAFTGTATFAGGTTFNGRTSHPAALQIGNAGSDPAAVTNNVVLYAKSGVLYARQADGTIVNISSPSANTGTMILSPQASQAYARGQLYYNSDTESLEFHNSDSGIALSVGQALWIRVWNASGSTITKGSPVYLSGVDATSGLPTIVGALATGIATIAMGITTESISTGASGFVCVSGIVSGFNTSSWTAGTSLFLGTTAGSLTSVAPTSPNFRVPVGVVLTSNATTGKLFVRIGSPILGFGSANQIIGMNSGGTALESKTISGTSNQITVTNAANSVTLAIPSSAALPGSPTTTTPTAGDSSTKIATTAFVAGFTAKVLVLGPSDSVPGGTPAGTVIVRTAS